MLYEVITTMNHINDTGNDVVVDVRDLKINIHLEEGTLTAVRGIDFTIKKGVITSYSIHYTKLYELANDA